MTSDEPSPYDFEKLARKLGQSDPQALRWAPRDNDHGPEPASRGTLFLAFVVGSLLAAVVIVWLFL
jgi:hypothetical protein